MNSYAVMVCGLMAGGATLAADPALHFQVGADGRAALRWQTAAGRQVQVRDPQITLEDPDSKRKLPLTVVITDPTATPGQANLRYALRLNTNNLKIEGAITCAWTLQENEDVLIGRMELSFNEPVHADLEAACSFDVAGEPARQMGLPERNGQLRFYPLALNDSGAGRFELGQAGKGPIPGAEIGIPVVGLVFDDKEPAGGGSIHPGSPLQLAVAIDPYCGGCIQGLTLTETGAPLTRITVRTTYSGTAVPLRSEQRTVALEFHRAGMDRTLRSL